MLVLDMYAHGKFRKEVAAAVEKAGGEKLDESFFSVPPSPEMGDLSCTVAFKIAKDKKKNPKQVAEEITKKIKPAGLIGEVKAVGPYVNFFVDYNKFVGLVLGEAAGKRYGSSDAGKGKKIVIDYSSVNIAKPMTVGHLRSTIIGQAIKNILDYRGFECFGINYLGDWGLQFGKLLAAYEKWGDGKELKKDPINYLVDLYIRYHKEENEQLSENADKWFRALEDGRKEARERWETFRKMSLKKFEEAYSLLGVKFDEFSGEAQYALSGGTMDVVAEALEKGVATKEAECTAVINLEKYGLPNARILEKGRTLYLTREIAAAKDRYKRFKFHKNIYVVASQQNLHFEQFSKILGLLGYPWAKDCIHVNFGFMSLPGGKKMSTRTGDFIELEEVLNKAIEEARKIMEKKNPDLKDKKAAAETVGVGAVVFADLSQNRIKDIEFDWNRFVSFDGDTGPYLQYAHVRCAGIIEKLGKLKKKPDFSLLTAKEETNLIRIISEFPNTIEQAADKYEPHVIAQYLIRLAHAFSSFYDACPVMAADGEELKASRLELVKATKNTLKLGLNLLGIQAPDGM